MRYHRAPAGPRLSPAGLCGRRQLCPDQHGPLPRLSGCARRARRYARSRTEHDGSLGLRSHYEEISRFLASLPALPDAFICPSDFIAHYIQRYLSETGVPAGKCPILTGFDNNAEYANVAEQITTVDVDTSSLGQRLGAAADLPRGYPQAPYETTYFSTQILYRGALAQP